jgi:hypothetical protein
VESTFKLDLIDIQSQLMFFGKRNALRAPVLLAIAVGIVPDLDVDVLDVLDVVGLGTR